ncbi:MAG TPA: DNA-deoxyinosine glycosylase [Methanospirillum sp.]|nr:DNA-deoxyinosine glycosylase [Methanospirillum sp.]
MEGYQGDNGLGKPPYGLAPCIGPACRVLILGSYPSVISLTRGQYYGNPRNGFWQIIGAVLGISPTLPYEERIARLIDQGAGLSDIYAGCHRSGSADATITSGIFTRFPDLITLAPGIRIIFLNGRTAQAGWKRYCSSDECTPHIRDLPAEYLPSSSPAHTMPLADKMRVWDQVRVMLEWETDTPE